MLKKLKQLFESRRQRLESRRYKIIYHPDRGYAALYNRRDIFGWEVIRASNELVPSDFLNVTRWFEKLWVATEEEAGQRINNHASKNQTKIIWEG